jgi:hypothetical protein
MKRARWEVSLRTLAASARSTSRARRTSFFLRHDPTPKITLGRLRTIDLHIQAALVKSNDLAGIQRHAPTQGPTRLRRDGEIRNDRSTHAGKRTHSQVRGGRNCQQPTKRSFEREPAALERSRDCSHTGTIRPRSHQAWPWRQPEFDCGRRRGPEQHGETAGAQKKASASLHCAPDYCRVQESHYPNP